MIMMSNMFYQQNSSDSQINQAGHASAVANSSLETTPSPSRSNLSKSNCDHDSIYYTQHKSYSQEGQYSITAQKLKKTQQRAAIGPMTRLWLAYDSKPQAKVGTLSNQRQIKQLKTWNHVEAKAGLTQVCILTLASQRWCSGILVFGLATEGQVLIKDTLVGKTSQLHHLAGKEINFVNDTNVLLAFKIMKMYDTKSNHALNFAPYPLLKKA